MHIGAAFAFGAIGKESALNVSGHIS